MKRRGLQISQRHRLALYAVSLALFLSGAAWAWIHRLDEAGQAGEALRRANAKLIAVHGLVAVGFVLVLGTLLPGHVRRAWNARKNRGQGAFFLAAMGLLTASGYALYYLGDDPWRRAGSGLHLWLGLIAPILLFWHIRTGKRAVLQDRQIAPMSPAIGAQLPDASNPTKPRN